MNIARLEVEDRIFYIPSDRVDDVMASVAVARAKGEWVELIDAGGKHVHLLVPSHALVVLERFDISDETEPWGDPFDWVSFDYDVANY